jgi:plastocyanin
MARGERKGWRRRLLLSLAGLLGAAVVVLPAIASSEGATVEAKGAGPYEWSPMKVTVSAGGVLTIKSLSANTNAAHGVKWSTGNPETPSCSGVPGASAGQPSFAAGWNGTCTFLKPGTYNFDCTLHGTAMSGSITVTAGGGTTGTSTGTTTTTSSTTTPTYPPPTTGTTGTPGAGTEGGGYGPPTSSGSGAGSSPPASLTKAIKLASSQHGSAVHGSLTVPVASAGARLEVDLLAPAAVLASAGHHAQVRVGTLVIAHLHSGAVGFSVGLSRRARNALRRRKHLTVTVRITLQIPGGSRLAASRSVTLHA